METKDKNKILPLADLKSGQKGKIIYLHTNNHEAIKKMMAIGALPGVKIGLIQKFPSYVFQIGQSQFAIDKELAGYIFIQIEV